MSKVQHDQATDQAVDGRTLDRLRRLGGNELVLKMIDLFSLHVESVIAQGFAAFDSGDLDGLERAAHSIKSSAGNLGAMEVRHLAEEIEEAAAHAGDRAILQQLMSGLAQAFQRAKARLHEERIRTAE